MPSEPRDQQTRQIDDQYPRFGTPGRFGTYPVPATHEDLINLYFGLPSYVERASRNARANLAEPPSRMCHNHGVHLRHDSDDLLNVSHDEAYCGFPASRPGAIPARYCPPPYDWEADHLAGFPDAWEKEAADTGLLKIVALAFYLENYLGTIDCNVACHIRKPLTRLFEGRLWDLLTAGERQQYAELLLDLRDLDDHTGDTVHPATNIRELALTILAAYDDDKEGLTPGPWEVRRARVYGYSKDDPEGAEGAEGAAVYHIYPVGASLHYVAETGRDAPNATRNAQAIAAVPDMLAFIDRAAVLHRPYCAAEQRNPSGPPLADRPKCDCDAAEAQEILDKVKGESHG